MRKILIVLMTVVCFSSLISCDSINKGYIQSVVDEMNELLPDEIDEGMTLYLVDIDNNSVVFHYLIDEDIDNLDAYKAGYLEAKKSLLLSLSEQLGDEDPDTSLFYETIVDMNYSIVYMFEGDTSLEEVPITVYPNDIKGILDSIE